MENQDGNTPFQSKTWWEKYLQKNCYRSDLTLNISLTKVVMEVLEYKNRVVTDSSK